MRPTHSKSLFSRSLVEIYESTGQTRQERAMQSQGGNSDSPSNGLGFTRSNVTKCSTLVSFRSWCHQNALAPAGKQPLAPRKANPRRYIFNYQGRPSHEAPDLVSLFYFFRLCVVPCRACLTVRPTLVTCRALIQISKTTTTPFSGGAS